MNAARPDRVKVKLVCGGHDHDLCVTVDRGVPPELRCSDDEGAGYGSGGGGGCRVPAGLDGLVARELRENFQTSKRQGFVLIYAA